MHLLLRDMSDQRREREDEVQEAEGTEDSADKLEAWLAHAVV
jgi:hypothetical protein